MKSATAIASERDSPQRQRHSDHLGGGGLADVPGGVVSHSLKEVDPSGRLVRRSTWN